jgi:hypothetical protein
VVCSWWAYEHRLKDDPSRKWILTVILFNVLTLIAISSNKINMASLLLPLTGLAVFLVKLWIIRRHKRFLKYVSWMGGTLITIWLLVFYINIPV